VRSRTPGAGETSIDLQVSLRARGPPLRRRQSCESRGVVSSLACLPPSRVAWCVGAEHTGLVMRKCDEALRVSVAWVVSPTVKGARRSARGPSFRTRVVSTSVSLLQKSIDDVLPKEASGSKEHAGRRGLARDLTRSHANRRSKRGSPGRQNLGDRVAVAQVPPLVRRCIGALGLIEGRRFGSHTRCTFSRGAKHIVVLAEPEHSLSGNRGERRR